MTKVHVGPKGGKYTMKGRKKVYLKSGSGAVAGKGAYRKKRSGRRVVRGKGSYWSDFKDWSSKTLRPFSRAGEALGSAIFGEPGAKVGSKIGNFLGKITGLGDYKVNSNTLLGLHTGGTNAGGVPRVENFSGRTVITHREYLRDINSSEDFENLTLEINPGIKATFPWLSDIAACYQQWKPLGILVCFESHSSNALNSTNTALGSLILSSNYEADAPDFKNQLEALNTEFTTSTKPSVSVIHPLECSPIENPQRIFYVRSGPLPADASSSLWYDLCKTQIMTVGSQAVSNVGKLYISYQIEFLKPVLNGAASGKTYQSAIYQLTGPTGGTPLGANTAVKQFDNIGLILGPTSIGFPQGNPGAVYQVQLNYYGGITSCVLEAPTVSGSDISLFPLYEDRNQPFVPLFSSTTGIFLNNMAVVMGPLGVGGILVLADSNALPTAIDSAELIVTRLHPGVAASSSVVPTLFKPKEPEKTPYERKLRDFLAAKENKHLSDEAKIMLFKELHVSKIIVNEPQTPQQPTDLSETTADLNLITTKIKKLAFRKEKIDK